MHLSRAKIVLSFLAAILVSSAALQAQSDEDSVQIPAPPRKVFGYPDAKT